MANWSLPTLTDLYTNFLAYLKARDDDAARLNDSRTPPTNPISQMKRWNNSNKTIESYESSAWNPVILAPLGGGTGANSAAGARTNLDVYSTAEADAAFAAPLSSSSSILSAPVNISVANTWYTGPSIALTSGTWFISGVICYMKPTDTVNIDITAQLYMDTFTYAEANIKLYTASASAAGWVMLPLSTVFALGGTGSMIIRCRSGYAGGYISTGQISAKSSYICAIKIA